MAEGIKLTKSIQQVLKLHEETLNFKDKSGNIIYFCLIKRKMCEKNKKNWNNLTSICFFNDGNTLF